MVQRILFPLIHSVIIYDSTTCISLDNHLLSCIGFSIIVVNKGIIQSSM